MPQIFISYAREDRKRIQPLAECLERHGWTVFWDRKIQAGQSWHTVISTALDQAERVIVAWSNDSLASDFVRDEAGSAKERKILVPILLDQVMPPLGFRQIQAADFTDWHGEEDAPALTQLLNDLGAPPAGRDASLPAAAMTSTATRAPETNRRKHPLLPYAVGGAGLVLGGIALVVARWGGLGTPVASATSATTPVTSSSAPSGVPLAPSAPPEKASEPPGSSAVPTHGSEPTAGGIPPLGLGGHGVLIPVPELTKVKWTLTAYYRDVNVGAFDAEKYFAPKVKRFINFENTSRGRIDRYFKSELPKMYADYRADMQADSLVKAKEPHVFTYREEATFVDIAQGKPRTLPATVRVEVDDDAKIVSFEQFRIVKLKIPAGAVKH